MCGWRFRDTSIVIVVSSSISRNLSTRSTGQRLPGTSKNKLRNMQHLQLRERLASGRIDSLHGNSRALHLSSENAPIGALPDDCAF